MKDSTFWSDLLRWGIVAPITPATDGASNSSRDWQMRQPEKRGHILVSSYLYYEPPSPTTQLHLALPALSAHKASAHT